MCVKMSVLLLVVPFLVLGCASVKPVKPQASISADVAKFNTAIAEAARTRATYLADKSELDKEAKLLAVWDRQLKTVEALLPKPATAEKQLAPESVGTVISRCLEQCQINKVRLADDIGKLKGQTSSAAQNKLNALQKALGQVESFDKYVEKLDAKAKKGLLKKNVGKTLAERSRNLYKLVREAESLPIYSPTRTTPTTKPAGPRTSK